ncbi:LON peptidase substrate-binding domain-containing protein [Celerinatantimonas yamalensis]|uniref:LON peptidase substrate-binding domain-containing protein n=1 Tax=Celerinatantimonas yamalensis TaxID=559956 RepID=A0ABW9G2T0_9GAMM
MPKQLPIFPLPAQVMPEGKLPLRIIEPKYIRMVRDCVKEQSSFGIVMAAPDATESYATLLPIGTAAKIIDFDQLEGGILGITALGYQRFRIIEVAQQNDGLRVATVEELPLWPDRPLPSHEQYIAQRLCDIYQQYPDLGDLYHCLKLNNLTWLCQRWLEILPIPVEQKQMLMATTTCERTHQLLTHLLNQAA